MAHSISSDFIASIRGSDFVSSRMSVNMTQDSEEVVEMYCETCHSDGKYEVATAFCSDCVEYFCKGCLRFHTKYRPSHKHLEGSDMPQDVCLEKCLDHADQLIKFYCDKCDKFACTECKENSHKNCRKVTHVPELVKGIENGEELKEIEQNLKRIDNKLKLVNKEVDDNKQTIERNKEDATFIIENLGKNIVETIGKNKDKLKAKIEEMKREDDKSLRFVSVRHSKMKSEVEKLKNQIKNQKDLAQRCKLFMTLKKARKDVMDFEKKLSDINKENVVLEYKFEPGMKLLTLAEKETEFGTIASAEMSKQQEVVFVQDINLNVKDENEKLDCTIWSMCLFQDNFLIVCDGRNCSIKSIDLRTNKMKSVLPMNNPICVSQNLMSYNKDVVSCISISELSLISVSMSGILNLLDQKIKTEMPCWDVVCKNDQLIVALFQIKSPLAGKVQILNTNGVVLSSFQTSFMGKSFRISKLALSFDKTSLFMIDLMKDMVIQMTTDGEVKALYENENLRQLNGLATSQSGSVYVCDSGSYKIHTVSADCSSSNVLLDQSYGLWRPISITYSGKDDKLYVGQAHQNCIKVYKL